MRRVWMLSALVGAIASAASGQQAGKKFVASREGAPHSKLSLEERMRRRPDILTARALDDVESEFARASKTLGETVLMSSDEKTFYLFVHRTRDSRPEVHARWDDLVMVKSGTGAIEMGDSLVGSEFRAMGERIGGRFHQSYKVVVHPGDMVRIPAVVPHAFIVSGKEPLDYVVIKLRRPELPVRWTGNR